MAGLLHDVGHVVLASAVPEAYAEAQAAAAGQAEPLLAERAVLSMDHTQVGQKLLQYWNLPDALQDAARRHHSLEICGGSSQPLTTMVAIGDTLARSARQRLRADVRRGRDQPPAEAVAGRRRRDQRHPRRDDRADRPDGRVPEARGRTTARGADDPGRAALSGRRPQLRRGARALGDDVPAPGGPPAGDLPGLHQPATGGPGREARRARPDRPDPREARQAAGLRAPAASSRPASSTPATAPRAASSSRKLPRLPYAFSRTDVDRLLAAPVTA